MTKLFRRNACLVAGAICLAVSSVQADVMYSNTTNDLSTRFIPGTHEVGDEILLTGTGAVTNFSFEYFWDVTGVPDPAQAQIKFYRMDGPLFNGYNTPGATLYTSGWFSLGTPTSRSTMTFLAGLDFPLAGLPMPDKDITWSVQFRNFGDDIVGVDLYSPPTVGSQVGLGDYWDNSGSGWTLETNSVPMNFGARFEGTIPEPSSLSLMVLGGFAALIMSRRIRR